MRFTIFLIFTYTLFLVLLTMKVHPLPVRTNMTIQYMNPTQQPDKKLRRLPHVFSRVLELPFRSDADVSVEEDQDCFRFVAETDCGSEDVRAQMIEIHPGVCKVVVRANGCLLDGLELDVWRFRLPETTRPELASAVCVDGELVVIVPKGGEDGNLNGSFVGNGWLVAVQ